MDIRRLIEGIVEARMGGEKVRGGKLADLTQDEIAVKEKLGSRARALQIRKDEFDLDLKQFELDDERWWNGVKSAHGLEAGHLQYGEGKIFEMVHKEDLPAQAAAPAETTK